MSPKLPEGSPCSGCRTLPHSQQSLRKVRKSNDCSMMVRRVSIWSTQHRFPLNPAWWPLCCWSTFVLSRMTLVDTFPGTESRAIPLKLEQSPRSPFSGSLSMKPSFQSDGTSSPSRVDAAAPYKLSESFNLFSPTISASLSRPTFYCRLFPVASVLLFFNLSFCEHKWWSDAFLLSRPVVIL